MNNRTMQTSGLVSVSREWQEQEQSALRWLHSDAARDPRGTGATALLMLRESATSEARMVEVLAEVAEEFDDLAAMLVPRKNAEERYRELAAKCREAAS